MSSPTTARPPDPGDLSICLQCGVWLVFETGPPDFRRRLATEAELAELSPDARRDAERFVATFRASRN